jgi:hypothetical protein
MAVSSNVLVIIRGELGTEQGRGGEERTLSEIDQSIPLLFQVNSSCGL